jgi:hypothetical protein
VSKHRSYAGAGSLFRDVESSDGVGWARWSPFGFSSGLGAASSNAEKDEPWAVQAHDGLIIEAPEAGADLCLGDGCDRVHHQPARRPKAVRFVRGDWGDEAKARR